VNVSAVSVPHERAVDSALSAPAKRTSDLGGPQSTMAFAADVCKEIDARAVR